MKTAISIPDRLFVRLEATRKRLQLTRSEVLQGALVKWLEQHEGQEITATINTAIEQIGDAATLDPELENAGLCALDREDW